MPASPGCVAVPLTRTGLFARTVLLLPFPLWPPGIQHILLGIELSFSNRLHPQPTKMKRLLCWTRRGAQRGTQSWQECYRRHQPTWQVRTPGKFSFKPLSKSIKPKPPVPSGHIPASPNGWEYGPPLPSPCHPRSQLATTTSSPPGQHPHLFLPFFLPSYLPFFSSTFFSPFPFPFSFPFLLSFSLSLFLPSLPKSLNILEKTHTWTKFPQIKPKLKAEAQRQENVSTQDDLFWEEGGAGIFHALQSQPC